MKTQFIAILLALLLPFRALAIDAEPPLQDGAQEALYQKLIHEVRCLVCQNQTVGDSTAPLAADLRREIRRLVGAGHTEEAVKSFLLERYGDFVLYRPQFTSATALLWLAPVFLLLAGALILIVIIKRRRKLPADIDADTGAAEQKGQGSIP